MAFVLIVSALGGYYFLVYRPNQKISRRTHLPPHVVTFDRLTRLPEGETRVDHESIIVDGYLITPTSMGTATNLWSFEFSEWPLAPRPDVSIPRMPHASIYRCADTNKTNCFDFDATKDNRYLPGTQSGEKQELLILRNIWLVGDRGETLPFSERVRLHGKLIMETRDYTGIPNDLNSVIIVTKIEKGN